MMAALHALAQCPDCCLVVFVRIDEGECINVRYKSLLQTEHRTNENNINLTTPISKV